MMELHPIKELDRRIRRGGERFFPRFMAALREAAEASIEERSGVLLLGHSPDIAPEAYCHTLYPPLPDEVICSTLTHFKPLPEELKALYRIMNGATLFWAGIEVWGIRTQAEPFSLPAFDIVEEASNVSCRDGIAFASNNCGDTVWLDPVSHSVSIDPRDTGLPTVSLPSIDEWIVYSKEVADEQT